MKPSVRALLVLLAIAAPLFAFDETIRIEPGNPSSTDPLKITVSGIWTSGCVPRFSAFDRNDRELTLRFSVRTDVPCTADLPPWSATVVVPALPAGKWDVRAVVATPQGDKVVAAVPLIVAPSETPFVVIPASSRMEGGTPVRLRAGGVGSCEPCPRVLFGGSEATSVRVVNLSEIEAVPPPHAPGRVDVTILGSGLGPSVTLPAAFRYYDHSDGPPEDAFETILVPIMFEGEGAFGSRWTTELTVHNAGEAPVDPWMAFVRCGPGTRCWPQLPPGATLHLQPSTMLSWIHGYLFPVPREQADDLRFTLHVRDASRESESLGTEIPVVRERELPRSPIVLLDVPLDPRFRRMLRVYDLAAIDGTRVVMRWRLDDGTQYAGDMQLVLRTVGRCIAAPCWLPEPAGIAVSLFDLPLPPNITQDHLHVEIEPLMPHSRIWAFITVTSNETQQVTTITP